MNLSAQKNFFELTPDLILDTVEAALGGVRATGRTLALNSLENRVYDIELEDQAPVIVKFYRPGRWTAEQILEEHEFVKELYASEIPVAAPLALKNGDTLGLSPLGLYFALFPKIRGRLVDELSDDQLRLVGRFIGRIHTVGARYKVGHRMQLDAETFGVAPLTTLKNGNWIDLNYHSRYLSVAQELIELARTRLDGVLFQAVHGDCHLGNLIWNAEGPCFLDFDDFVLGPPVQDLWLLLPGRDEESIRMRNLLLEGYETMRSFDHKTLQLIEPLRALRLIRYSAWIAERWSDPAFKNMFSGFDGVTYWQEETEALEGIRRWVQNLGIT